MDTAEHRGRIARGHLDDLIRDAQRERERYEEQLSINAMLVHGDHKSVFAAGSDNNYFVGNHIENAVITQTAVMTEKDIRPQFVPRETNEPPEIFLRPESRYKAEAVEGNGLSEGQLMGAEVIPEQLFDFLAAATDTQTQPNPRAGEPMGAGENAEVQPDEIEVEVPIFTDEDFIFVTDALCAEALTQEMMSEWEMCGADEKLRQSIFEAVSLGWKDMLVQWNEQESHFELANLYPFNCWIDRWATSTRDAEYYVLRQIMPVSEALREYPEAEEQIYSHKTVSADTNSWGGRDGGKYDRATDREIVEVFTVWERNYPFPMELDRATETGLIQPAVEDALVDPETGEVADMGGTPIVDEQGQQKFILADTGEDTSPGMGNWPKRYGIKQMTLIGDYVIQEMECEAVDLPIARIRNIPIIESPYGEGEPQRLGDLQDLMNRLWSIFHDYALFFRGTDQAMPNSVFDQLGDRVGTLHRTMGRKFGVPDDLWQAFQGQIIQGVAPPQLSNTYDMIMGRLEAQFDRISGVGDVLRGEAKSEWSGELFAQATSAARGPIGFKARHISDAVKYKAKIIGGYIIDFLPLDEWVKRNKKYPPQILEVMRSRLKRIGYDVSVEVGGASSRDGEAQRLSIALQNNPMLVNSETFMKQWTEYMGIKEGEKIVKEIQQAQMQQLAPQA